jgi:hypothetical protein
MLRSKPKKLRARTRYKRSPGMGDTLGVYRENAQIARKLIFSHPVSFLRRHRIVRTAAHQDESPAEYSLTGCSPAAPVSAFSAALILNPKPSVCQAVFSERQTVPCWLCLNSRRSSMRYPETGIKTTGCFYLTCRFVIPAEGVVHRAGAAPGRPVSRMPLHPDF